MCNFGIDKSHTMGYIGFIGTGRELRNRKTGEIKMWNKIKTELTSLAIFAMLLVLPAGLMVAMYLYAGYTF